MCKSGLRVPVGRESCGVICAQHLYLSLPFNGSTVKDQKERRGLCREVSIRAGRVSASISHSAACRFSVHRCRIWAREALYVSQDRPSASSPSSWLLKLCLALILCFFRSDGAHSQCLKKTEVNLISHELCQSHSYYGKHITENMLCAGSPGWTTDACSVSFEQIFATTGYVWLWNYTHFSL